MTGKDKCKMLREIRRQIAEENDINMVVEECKFQGDCKGTCPKCEAELRELERQVRNKKIGIGVAIATGAIATTVSGAVVGANIVSNITSHQTAGEMVTEEQIAGSMMYIPEVTEEDVQGNEEYTPDVTEWELEGDVAADPTCEDGSECEDDSTCEDGSKCEE